MKRISIKLTIIAVAIGAIGFATGFLATGNSKETNSLTVTKLNQTTTRYTWSLANGKDAHIDATRLSINTADMKFNKCKRLPQIAHEGASYGWKTEIKDRRPVTTFCSIKRANDGLGEVLLYEANNCRTSSPKDCSPEALIVREPDQRGNIQEAIFVSRNKRPYGLRLSEATPKASQGVRYKQGKWLLNEFGANL